MKHQLIPNTDLNVSSYCYGVMFFGTRAKGDDAYRLYEQFVEAGGNLFDTAHGYACWMPEGDGASERTLGDCLQKFGNRKDMVISTKGALIQTLPFYPRPDDTMTAEVIGSDISESLERLRIDYIDLYTLHRDDTRHTVGEIIEILNAEIRRGRIRYLGASNWTPARIAEANAYAEAHGLQGFVTSSPQWNLCVANHQPYNWDGTKDDTCRVTTDEDVAWHRKTGFPMMPWTPSAYGYLSGLETSNAMSFDNPTSRRRRERARELAGQKGCTPLQIGLAYLRSYEFPVFPILGTMNPEHLAESLGADAVELTAAERDWLVAQE